MRAGFIGAGEEREEKIAEDAEEERNSEKENLFWGKKEELDSERWTRVFATLAVPDGQSLSQSHFSDVR